MAAEKPQIDSGLADSIAMLEQILEVMPHDIDALMALYNACRKCGRQERAFEYLGMMVDVAGDAETAAFIVEQLPSFESEFPSETAAQLARIRTLVVNAPAPVAGRYSSAPQQAATDIAEELALAWKLYEENQLTQEEYSSVLHDLTEVSSKELDVPISVLHVLNDRGFTQITRVMNYMSSRSGVPCLSLAGFELPAQVADVLPPEIPAHDGAVPFGFFGNDLLVGVLNPFNNMVVDKVETASGHRCHSFLVTPEEYDIALGRLRAMAS
jgi:hypothetical protein